MERKFALHVRQWQVALPLAHTSLLNEMQVALPPTRMR